MSAVVASALSTPANTVTRENLPVLVRNNTMNDSLEFMADCDVMCTDSPVRKPDLQPISKKLFHSPLPTPSPEHATCARDPCARALDARRRARKRKQVLIPGSSEKIKRAYVAECEGDGYSPDRCGGTGQRVLISLFHNKEYSMDVC